mmetsp:Transcript_8546/g.15284  ORF Transcript_8546/g.15284 Transcript_8546/m.15284 type:complete len:261 (-) Transcript_8546:110-892(-)
MSYSQGVLIHNFNEDRYGSDLQRAPKPADPPATSISHMVHSWKQPEQIASVQDARAMQSVERHILFGHTGDMRDPHTNLQKAEYTTASQYFFQDPAKVGPVGSLTADRFTLSDDPVKVSKRLGNQSFLANRQRERWGNGMQTHALPSDERFTTTHMVSFPKSRLNGQQQIERLGKAYQEFTRQYDASLASRSLKAKGPAPLKTASHLLLQQDADKEAAVREATQGQPLDGLPLAEATAGPEDIPSSGAQVSIDTTEVAEC